MSQEGDVTKSLPVNFVLEDGIIRAKEWRQFLEAAKDKKTDSLLDFPERNTVLSTY